MYKLSGSIFTSGWRSRASKKRFGPPIFFYWKNKKISRYEYLISQQIDALGQRRSNHDEYWPKTLSRTNWIIWIVIFRVHDPELFYGGWSRKRPGQHPNHTKTTFLSSIQRSSMPDTPQCPTVGKSRRPIEWLFRSRWEKKTSPLFFIDKVNQNWESVQQVYT